MAELPTGTVTLLFTDIEGSTRLLRQMGEDYAGLLAEHRRLLRAAFTANGGREVDTQGDAFFIAFDRAFDAVAAAAAVQRSLAGHAWPDGGAVRVRIGLHTGEPALVDDLYVGLDVHRAARLCAAGHGGQVLLSDATRALAEQRLPPGTSLRDLGEHRLKDLQRPERIFQLVVADLPSEFPPLRTAELLPNNLPTQLTSFVGRERQIADVQRLMASTRLLTLVGSGGAGKTRLALQVAASLLEHFSDGVWLVELAPLADTTLVPQAVTSALGIRNDSVRSPLAALAEYLHSRELLLLLDNCEHLMVACAEMAEGLLRIGPKVRILATSREALDIPGETIWRVPSLTCPDPRHLPPAEQLSAYEAVHLFIDRAAAALSGFTVTNANAPALVQICQQLDGIPLAIELAAARVKVLTPEQIAARLDDRFRLLTGGSRTALPRQQTLRALVDWSYDLLLEPERMLWRRLSVFAGGWTLQAVEGICASGGIDEYEVLDLLAQLIDKSLVLAKAQHGAARYALLETLRKYGLEKLRTAGEDDVLRRRHRDWFAELVRDQAARLSGPGQADAFACLEAEHENLRATLDWCEIEPGGWEIGARIADELVWFWCLRGYVREGHERLSRLLALAIGHTEGRARALSAAGQLAHHVGESERAAGLFEESIAIWRDLGDRRGAAIALARFGQFEQAQGDYEHAWLLLNESRSLFQEVGTESGLDAPLAVFLAQVAKNRGDHERAIALFQDCLRLAEQQGDKHAASGTLRSLGELMQLEGAHERAAAYLRDSLILIHELDDRACAVTTLDSLAILAAARGDAARAARLLAVAGALREAQGVSLSPAERYAGEQAAAAARMQLGPTIFDTAWSEGRAMTLEQAITYALLPMPE
jgi:predicted ATPase/class 3 adenylate cyclase